MNFYTNLIEILILSGKKTQRRYDGWKSYSQCCRSLMIKQLIAEKWLDFECKLWQNYKLHNSFTSIIELHVFPGFQICATFACNPNRSRVISIFVGVTRFKLINSTIDQGINVELWMQILVKLQKPQQFYEYHWIAFVPRIPNMCDICL